MQVRIAVMLTCHNRRLMTQNCLQGLSKQIQRDLRRQYDIYVYDDYSTDGTWEMLKTDFAGCRLIRGKGKTYWCTSMYYLMKLALNNTYDFYLMVNDDVSFFSDAIETMFHAYEPANCKCGIVGATRSAGSGEGAYGGRDQEGKLIAPDSFLQRCRWADWNCFLVDSDTVKRVGIIDGKYQHSWGDFDYSDRMFKKGIPLFLATEYVGTCETNPEKGTYRDRELGRLKRLRKLFSPKGLPVRSYMRYNAKTKGVEGVLKGIYGYCSIVGYILAGKEIDG